MTTTFQKEILSRAAPEFVRLRQARGLSAADVALMTDLSMRAIYMIESGKLVSYKKIRRLLRFYNQRFELKIVEQS